MLDPGAWFNDSSIAVTSILDVVTAVQEMRIRLPLFQRDAVWDEGRSCALWDSLLRGFPLPSFFLSEGRGNSRELSSGGRSPTRKDGATGGHYFDLIDGQQRLNAIYRGFKPDRSLQLWLDLAPPSEPHPRRFRFWLHPCTRAFPLGFQMRADGEYGFAKLTDAELREIQNHPTFGKREFFELSPREFFPWTAKCPVELSEIIDLAWATKSPGACAEGIIYSAQSAARKISEQHGLSGSHFAEPNESVVDRLVEGLFRLRDCHLAFQAVDASEDSFTLFERLGRGGIQISQRQLAVSELILAMGAEANDAVAGFHNSKWQAILDTEEIIHAVARVSYAAVCPPPEPAGSHGSEGSDLFELDLARVKRLKLNKTLWSSLTEKMGENCDRICDSFSAVFGDVLRRRALDNDNGFSLVQLAQTGSVGGINSVSLHPVLCWGLLHWKGDKIDEELREEFLKWIVFSNGLTINPAHKKLNQLVFSRVREEGRLSFQEISDLVFSDFTDRDREDLGFHWSIPWLDSENSPIVDRRIAKKCIPTPSEITERTLRRLALRNWADRQGVNDFVLMWNQGEFLEKVYGNTDSENIVGLYGKGRPFDLDHIVARDLLSGHKISVDEPMLHAVVGSFFDPKYRDKIALRSDTFRLRLPNLNGNYRFWPKALNRADGNGAVSEKLETRAILDRASELRYLDVFADGPVDVGWRFSAILDKSHWENLPPKPNNGVWPGSGIASFVTAILSREFDLYSRAYNFVTGNSVSTELNLDSLIKD